LVRARWTGAEFWLVAYAVGAKAFAFALTVTVNFPIMTAFALEAVALGVVASPNS
jgi:hypothetical protein